MNEMILGDGDGDGGVMLSLMMMMMWGSEAFESYDPTAERVTSINNRQNHDSLPCDTCHLAALSLLVIFRLINDMR